MEHAVMEHEVIEHDVMQESIDSAGTPRSVEQGTVEFFPSPRHRTDVTLAYEPPYENELDDALARHFVAYLVPAASLTYRSFVTALYSRCRYDFLIDLGTRRIAIDYTDTPIHLATALVEDNDALALGTGTVDVVLRVRRRDLEDRLHDCLHLIAKWEPALFTPYGQRVFARRATEAARCVRPEPESDLASITYRGESDASVRTTIDDVLAGDMFEWPDETKEDSSVLIRRMSRAQPSYWRRHYARATLVYSRAPISRH